jgi:hypothetical protein
MGQMELLLNVYAAKNARGSTADYMGHCVVQPEEASSRLTPGLWLVCCQTSYCHAGRMLPRQFHVMLVWCVPGTNCAGMVPLMVCDIMFDLV